MKLLSLTIAICTLLVFSGCSSIHNISAKDSASGATSLKKANRNSGTREFMNGIEVTPGGMVASSGSVTSKSNAKTKAANAAARKEEAVAKNTIFHEKPEQKMASALGIESAGMLQLKYAIATDATVEKMNNIPLLETIDKWWGTKYCLGGFTNDCIDCSAFTQIVLRDVYQVALPRTSQEQYNACEKIELEDLREGDLVFFNTAGNDVSHVGVYLLNNKFVHAATSGGVMISDLNEKYWQPRFRGAGRIRKEQEVAGSK
ncbi:MAG: NlpC/P60 family protein [Bacteroidota bacterium]